MTQQKNVQRSGNQEWSASVWPYHLNVPDLIQSHTLEWEERSADIGKNTCGNNPYFTSLITKGPTCNS